MSGFKSYRSQLEMEEFSPRHNCVVGRNGSGKRYVLPPPRRYRDSARFCSSRQRVPAPLCHTPQRSAQHHS